MSVGDVLSANGGLGYLIIHSVQFGMQPLLSKACIAAGTPTSSLVLGAETAKALACLVMLRAEGNWREAVSGWTLRGAIWVAGVPSVTYLVQNYCIQIAYQNIDGVVFNILNQTKMLFTALFSFLMMGRKQSRMQCVALVMVTAAGVLISISEGTAKVNGHNGNNGNGHAQGHRALGTVCILMASALSGFGSGITEWILQGQRRNSYVFSAEMALFGCAMISGSLLFNLSPDAQLWREEGLFSRWRWQTLIPVLTQGWGGIVVGLITKVAGGVKKGFAVISGLILTCLVKSLMYGEPLSSAICVACPLVGCSIVLHARYPPVKPKAK